jgi:hypothetical protein
MSAIPLADNGVARVHRSQSTRHPSSSQSHAYRPSGDNHTNLANVARRDFEQLNAAQPTNRRSASRDRGTTSQVPARSDSARNGHGRSERRYVSIDASSSQQQPPTNGMVADHPSSRPSGTTQQRKRTYITCSTGTWALGKTIGQGSMGKVKLAKNQESGEQV